MRKPFICTSESWVDQWLVSLSAQSPVQGPRERAVAVRETVALNLLRPVCRSNQSRPVLCGASTAGLWPWWEATHAQCFCWPEPRSWILWKVRFWGPFCVNNGAILAAVDLDSDAPYVKAGSVQVGPKPASRIFGSSRCCESVRKSTPILCPLAHCSPRAAQHQERCYTVFNAFRLLPTPVSPVNRVVLMSTLVP